MCHDTMGISISDMLKTQREKLMRERGFTLMEVMIVVAIVGIGAALTVPNYMAWQARYQLRQAATEIQNQLSLARISAMSRNSLVTMNVALTSGRVTISATDASGASVIPSTQMSAGVTGLNPAPTSVAFSPMGTRSGGGAGNQQIQLTNRYGLSYSLRVTPGGKVNWCAAATCP
jgi:prepilin-type N-terminal cleavage/methylation domain-containing protein